MMIHKKTETYAYNFNFQVIVIENSPKNVIACYNTDTRYT